MGVKAYLVIQMTVLMIAGSVGVWLFYVQHQFEGAYWEHQRSMGLRDGGVAGQFILPVAQGAAVVYREHRFPSHPPPEPGIPNYNLEKCHKADPLLQGAAHITLLGSFKSFSYRLWDEQRQKMVGFGHLRSLRRG